MKKLTISFMVFLATVPTSFSFPFSLFNTPAPEKPNYTLTDEEFNLKRQEAVDSIEKELQTETPFNLKFDRQDCTINRKEYKENFADLPQDDSSFEEFKKSFYNFNNSAIKFFVKEGFSNLAKSNPTLVIEAIKVLKKESSTKINCRYPWYTFHNPSSGFWLPFSNRVYYNALIVEMIQVKKKWDQYALGMSSTVASDQVNSQNLMKREIRKSYAPIISIIMHELFHRLKIDNRPILTVHNRFFKEEIFDHTIRGNAQPVTAKRVLGLNPDTNSVATYNQRLSQCQIKQLAHQCKDNYRRQIKPLFSTADPALKYLAYCSDSIRTKSFLEGTVLEEKEFKKLVAACQKRQVAYEIKAEITLEAREKVNLSSEISNGKQCSLVNSKTNKKLCLEARRLNILKKGLDCQDVQREFNPFGFTPTEKLLCQQTRDAQSKTKEFWTNQRRDKIESDVAVGLNCDRIEKGEFFEYSDVYYEPESSIRNCQDLVEITNNIPGLGTQDFLNMNLNQYRQRMWDYNQPQVVYNQKLLEDRGNDTVYACDIMAGIDVANDFKNQYKRYTVYLQGSSPEFPLLSRESFYQKNWLSRCLTCSMAQVKQEGNWLPHEKLSQLKSEQVTSLVNRCNTLVIAEDRQRRTDSNFGTLPGYYE